MSSSPSRFLERQERFFAEADVGHFFWQTANPYFARTERELLAGFSDTSARAILEVGCGEGGNLVNVFGSPIARSRLVVGLDRFEAKLAFARQHTRGMQFVCADATALPFQTAAFDAVLCRDLLHHLEDREAAVSELRRVARKDAAVWVVEPNGRNPLVKLLALVRPHERGQLANTPQSLRRLLSKYFPDVEVELRQPMPVYRLLLHYQFGAPRLGRSVVMGALLDAGETVLRTVVPRRWWAYIIVRAGREPSAPS